jgi:hypothetical protein
MEQAQTTPAVPTAAAPSRDLRALLLVAGAGALVILIGFFGTIGAVIGLVMIAVPTVLSAASSSDEGWWRLLAVGAGLSILAPLVAQVAETLGGLIGVLAGILVLVAATFGYPYADGEA